VVLRGRQLGEADRILTLFTTQRGKLDAVAKGVRRPRSHLGGRVEPFNECDFLMHRGRSLDVIVSAEIVRSPWTRLVEPERYAAAAVVGELIDAFCEPDLALPDVYELLVGAIAAIAASSTPGTLLPRFSLRLLGMLGLAPPLTSCIRCGNPLPSGSVWLDAQAGGFVDDKCRERWQDLPELAERDLANLRSLALPKEAASGATLLATPQAKAAVEELVAHHLGKRPKALAQLGSLGA
jgi:DNA repair protein RecO (recombination protein O)